MACLCRQPSRETEMEPRVTARGDKVSTIRKRTEDDRYGQEEAFAYSLEQERVHRMHVVRRCLL